jgi:hypothetical protein
VNAHSVFVGALLVAGALPLAGHVMSSSADDASNRLAAGHPSSISVEWPTHFRDRPLTPLALGELEQRFAHRFPGSIARFTDGERMLVVRHVTRPTRQLHPAEDCFKALAYTVDARNRWSMMRAKRGAASSRRAMADSCAYASASSTPKAATGPTFRRGSGRRSTVAGRGARPRS